MTRATETIWIHKPTGDLYSIQRSDSGKVTFALGPIQDGAVIQDVAAVTAWVNDHLDEFDLLMAAGTLEVHPKKPEPGTPTQ